MIQLLHSMIRIRTVTAYCLFLFIVSATAWAQTTATPSKPDATQSEAQSDAAISQDDDKLTPCHWRIVWLNDPTTEVTVLWDTHAAGDNHVVKIRAQSDRGSNANTERSAVATTEKAAFLRSSHTEYFHHQAKLDNLLPGTRYELQLVSDGHASRWFHFDTARNDGKPFRMIFGGDSRTGLETRKQVNQMIAGIVAKSWTNDSPDDDVLALMHGGDFVFSGTDPGQWHQWLEDHELTATTDGRLLPVIPARGNHDRGRLFAQVFGFDPSHENYYGQSYGNFLRIVTLNTEASIAGDQADWLASELSSSRPAHRWLIAQYHRPAYAAVKTPSGALAHWVPLFEKHNVDLVCEADGHNIKRTLPIRNGTHDPTGIVYIGEGGMGVPQRTPKSKRWFLQSPGFASSGHHVHLLQFTENRLSIECQSLDGSILDRYQISSDGR